MKKKVLIVEDEKDIAELIEYNLRREGFQADCVYSGEKALEAVSSLAPDIVVLDLMLPGLDGLSVCREIKGRESTKDTPIMMVTAHGAEEDIVAGLELGADDYVVKPFSPKVLVARIRALLRRAGEKGHPSLKARAGGMEIIPGRREVIVEGKKVPLTFTEFNILLFLSRNPGWVYTRSQISGAVRGGQYNVTERSVDVHIRSLRRKLGTVAANIETVRGVGYRFKD